MINIKYIINNNQPSMYQRVLKVEQNWWLDCSGWNFNFHQNKIFKKTQFKNAIKQLQNKCHVKLTYNTPLLYT